MGAVKGYIAKLGVVDLCDRELYFIGKLIRFGCICVMDILLFNVLITCMVDQEGHFKKSHLTLLKRRCIRRAI